MKTRIAKIIIVVAALIFVSSGVSFAHDWNDRDHKPAGKANGHYKVKKHHPGWNNKHSKPYPYYRNRYVYKQVRGHRYSDDHQRRPAPRRTAIYKVAKKDTIVAFKILVKGHR